MRGTLGGRKEVFLSKYFEISISFLEGTELDTAKNPTNLTKKTLDVLEYISAAPRSSSLQEIAQSVGLAPATTHRILTVLKESGYVVQRENKDYCATYKMYVMSGRIMENDPYVAKALPFLNYFILKLGADCGASLTAFCEDSCVNLISAGKEMRFRAKLAIPGAAHPCHCTAAGKLFLSCLSEEELEQWLSRNPLLPYTKYSITDADELKKELEQTRERGYATMYAELTDNLAVISIPVHRKGKQIDLAANFSIAISRFSEINNPGFIQSVQDLLQKYNFL